MHCNTTSCATKGEEFSLGGTILFKRLTRHDTTTINTQTPYAYDLVIT